LPRCRLLDDTGTDVVPEGEFPCALLRFPGADPSSRSHVGRFLAGKQPRSELVVASSRPRSPRTVGIVAPRLVGRCRPCPGPGAPFATPATRAPVCAPCPRGAPPFLRELETPAHQSTSRLPLNGRPASRRGLQRPRITPTTGGCHCRVHSVRLPH